MNKCIYMYIQSKGWHLYVYTEQGLTFIYVYTEQGFPFIYIYGHAWAAANCSQSQAWFRGVGSRTGRDI
jgi:hypothetical protein